MSPQARQLGRAFRHRFEGPAYRKLLICSLRVIPGEILRPTVPIWAAFFYAFVPSARSIVRKNLARMLVGAGRVQVERATYQVFVHYSQSIVDLYSFHIGREPPIAVTVAGRERVQRILDGGRGVITVTGHLGAWQITPYLIQRSGALPSMTITMAEEPNPELGRFEERFRSRFQIVYTTRSPYALIELATRLRRTEIVGMQLDRHLGGPHVKVPFCGMSLPFPLGPAMLARTSGCPLVPVFSLFTDPDRRRVTVFYEEPIEVPQTRYRNADLYAATVRLVSVYESYVRRYPHQWFNFYDFWSQEGILEDSSEEPG
jgi:KDO2-lipid IV(A) lauroyltransferase